MARAIWSRRWPSCPPTSGRECWFRRRRLVTTGRAADETLTEESRPGDDFLSEVCAQWETRSCAGRESSASARRCCESESCWGPAEARVQKMLPPFKLGLGGRLGNGRQWMPWIHVEDLAELFLHVATDDTLRGPINAVAPHLVRNESLPSASRQGVTPSGVFARAHISDCGCCLASLPRCYSRHKRLNRSWLSTRDSTTAIRRSIARYTRRFPNKQRRVTAVVTSNPFITRLEVSALFSSVPLFLLIFVDRALPVH